MPVRSKWQSLPTEAINPSSLDIDKLAADDIVELMINEDRKMLAAVQRERERIALGVEMISAALRGQAPSEDLYERAGALAADNCTPVTDARGSQAYKRHLANELTKRSLRRAVRRITETMG